MRWLFANLSLPYIKSLVARYGFALQLRRMCYKDGVKLLLFKYQVLENLFRDWGSDIRLERRSEPGSSSWLWNRDMIFISRSKLLTGCPNKFEISSEMFASEASIVYKKKFVFCSKKLLFEPFLWTVKNENGFLSNFSPIFNNSLNKLLYKTIGG